MAAPLGELKEALVPKPSEKVAEPVPASVVVVKVVAPGALGASHLTLWFPRSTTSREALGAW